MPIRSLILGGLIAFSLFAGRRDTGWQTGTFRIDGGEVGGWRGSSVSASRQEPGRQSFNPLSTAVSFEISSAVGTYKAVVSGLLADRSMSTTDLFPWLLQVPSAVQFRVKGHTLYLIDSNNKQHKAKIIKQH